MRLLLALCLTLCVGCGGRKAEYLPPPALVATRIPEPLQPRFDRLAKEGARNEVLHLNELAVGAMKLGERDLAARCLSESMLQINAVFGSTPEAAKARSIFFNEDVKLYKGDAYERAMVFLYRGILYMQEGDYENARACFRSGVLQDAFAEEEQNKADWVIFDYLIAVCEMQMNRDFYSQEALERAEENFATFPERYRQVVKSGNGTILGAKTPTLDPRGNVLVICQQGRAPIKYRRGEMNQYLSIKRPMNQPGPSTVKASNGAVCQSLMLDSVFFQAATRGGRPFDVIQKRKAIIKGSTDTVGTAGMWTGAIIMATANNEGQLVAGAIVLAGGLALKGFSLLVKTGADNRQWESLPDSLSVCWFSLPAGDHTITVENGFTSTVRTVRVAAPGKGLTVLLTFPEPDAAILAPTNPVFNWRTP